MLRFDSGAQGEVVEIDIAQNVAKLWNAPEGRNPFALYCLGCLLGQAGNAFWLFLGKEIDCVMDRFRDDWRSTTKAILTNIGIVVGIAFAIPFEGVPIAFAFFSGIMQGVTSDSKLNKSARKIWTEEKRETVTGEVRSGN